MSRQWECVVVGAGALGAATAYWLARRGCRDILVVEQYELGHTRGASEDRSRIIRHSYHSNAYADLTRAAYDGWEDLERRSGLTLVHKTGGLDLARPGGTGEGELATYRRSLDHNGEPYQDLDAGAIRRRWPQWRIPDDTVGLFQAEGGLLDVGRATATHLTLARGMGVEVAAQTPVRRVEAAGGEVQLDTPAGTLRSQRVVLCTASWSGPLLSTLGVEWPITLSQEQVSYFATPNLRDFAPDRFPVWLWHGEPQLYYGFPVYGEVAVKAAKDMAGRFVTQQTRREQPDPEETAQVARFLGDHLPGALGPELVSRTCVYDMPPDRDFILDRLPEQAQVSVAIGAGHAAKFADLIGQIMADISLDGDTAHPVAPFRADRPALTDPDFSPVFRLAPH